MRYKPQKQRIADYIRDRIVTYLRKKDLDYYKVLRGMSMDLGVSEEKIEEVLRIFVENKEIREIRILTIPDEQIGDWLKEVKEINEEKKKMDKAMKKIENEVEVK